MLMMMLFINVCSLKEKVQDEPSVHLEPFLCRKEETRTPDPYVPNVVRYQLRYFPNAQEEGSLPRAKLAPICFAGAKVHLFWYMAKEIALFFVIFEVFFKKPCRIQEKAIPLHPQTRRTPFTTPLEGLLKAKNWCHSSVGRAKD